MRLSICVCLCLFGLWALAAHADDAQSVTSGKMIEGHAAEFDSGDLFRKDYSYEWRCTAEYNFVFSTKSYDDHEDICIYLKTADGNILAKRLETHPEFTYIERIRAFWWKQPGPAHQTVPLIWVNEVWEGSGHFTEEHVFAIVDLPPISAFASADELKAAAPHMVQAVEYVKPPAPFKLKLEKGQECLHGVRVNLGEAGLEFYFRYESRGDANNSPSGGKVRGTFKLVTVPLPEPEVFGPIKHTVRYRLETDAFRQGPLTDEDY